VEEPAFGARLAETGGRGLDVVQVLRDVTRLSAWRSRQLMEEVLATVVQETWFEAAAGAVSRLESVGATADLVCLSPRPSDRSRYLPSGPGPVCVCPVADRQVSRESPHSLIARNA